MREVPQRLASPSEETPTLMKRFVIITINLLQFIMHNLILSGTQISTEKQLSDFS